MCTRKAGRSRPCRGRPRRYSPPISISARMMRCTRALLLPIATARPHIATLGTCAMASGPHHHTLGVHDHEQWPEAYTCDFISVTEDIAGRVEDVSVNLDTDASDHQPVLLRVHGCERGRLGQL